MESFSKTSLLGKLLEWGRDHDATDLHARAGVRYSIRVDGKLQRIPPSEFPVPSHNDILMLLRESFSVAVCERINRLREMDLTFACGGMRYRANFSKQQGTQSFSFRHVPQSTPNILELGLPSGISDMVRKPRGLVLVTGASGQGKSTTACALIQGLNETVAARVITIEDPIEYLFVEAMSQFEQREIGVDTANFADAIRNAVRQDPEVIFVGEIRDRDTVQAAMQAAETGHLVIATMHADSVPQTIDRIRELHPAQEQANASALLARCLNGVVCQRLVPGEAGHRIPCLEILKSNSATQAAMASNDLHLLVGIIEASDGEGMQSFDQHLKQLLASGAVSLETARYYAVNWNKLDMVIHGFIPSTSGILRPNR